MATPTLMRMLIFISLMEAISKVLPTFADTTDKTYMIRWKKRSSIQMFISRKLFKMIKFVNLLKSVESISNINIQSVLRRSFSFQEMIKVVMVPVIKTQIDLEMKLKIIILQI